MGRAKHLESYKEEWAEIAEELTNGKGEVTFELTTKAEARALSLRFYNFRNALERHDAENPWLKTILGKVATVKQGAGGWELRIGDDEFLGVLRRALGPKIEPPRAEETMTPQGQSTEDVLSELYGPKSKEEK